MISWILIISLNLAAGLTATSRPINPYRPLSQASPPQAQNTQTTDQFLKRLEDKNFSEIMGGATWTLIHDYKDYKHIEEVLNTMQGYTEGLASYEQGDDSSLRRLGGIKKLKDQLAIWLEDSEQAVRAFGATMLGVSGDQAYSSQLAKLLERKEDNPDELVYDRGRAALALGLLQAKEYGKALVTMLSSKNEYDRAGALQGLGWMGDKEHSEAVAQLLNDKDENVRESAKVALEMLRTGRVPTHRK